MLITDGDRLKHHFENVVAVKLFTVPEILTIINHFSAEVTEGTKYVFSHDYSGKTVITDLDAKQLEDELLGIANEENQQREWGRWAISEVQCPECFEWFSTDCYSKEEMKTCPACGAHLIGGTQNDG